MNYRGIQAIADGLHDNRSLTSVDLSDNCIGEEVINKREERTRRKVQRFWRKLRRGISNSDSESDSDDGRPDGEYLNDGVIALSKALRANTSLRSLK